MSATLIHASSPGRQFLDSARAHHARNELLPAAEAYRQTLASHPRSPEALLGLSLIARQSNQMEPALHMAEAALAAAPGSALAWANFGDTLAALRRNPQARAAFRHALALDSGVAAAHYGLGNTFALEENCGAALASFQTAALLTPSFPEFHFAAAFALGKLGRHAEAIAAYRRAVQLRPGFASAWLNLGVELIADGRDALAELCYRQALADSSQDGIRQIHTRISAWLNLGHLQRRRREFDRARASYEQAMEVAQGPGEPALLPHSEPGRLSRHARRAEACVAFAYLHLEQKEFDSAWESLQRAEFADPDGQNPEIPNARGILLLAEESAQSANWVSRVVPSRCGTDAALEEALAAFCRAESAGHRTAASNRGNALLRLGRVGEALAAHQTALALDPFHPGVRYNLALTQLRAGDFAEGWRNYEIRWQFREVHPRPRRFREPRWNGAALEAQATLFVYAEQGLGDTLQFVRYLQLVAKRLCGVPLILEAQPPVVRLLAQSLARWKWPASTPTVLTPGDPLPPFTHHCPLMSLPALFQTSLASVPAPIPYLYAPKTDGDAPPWTRFLHKGRGGQIAARIGIHWAGNPNYRADRERSTSLATFLPLLQIPNIQWISLQHGPAALQIAEILPRLPQGCLLVDACSQNSDLADTAAVLDALDLVITTDTAVAHLAGALGKPLWLLLPWQSDWRWMQETPVTPWYPTARLFRQSSPGNWPELMARVALALRSEGFADSPCAS